MMIVLGFAYLGLCFCIALLGTDRKFGYWGYFFCALFMTPMVGAIVLLGSDRRLKPAAKCSHCSQLLLGPPK